MIYIFYRLAKKYMGKISWFILNIIYSLLINIVFIELLFNIKSYKNRYMITGIIFIFIYHIRLFND